MPRLKGPLWVQLLLAAVTAFAIVQVCCGQRRTKRTAIIPGDIMIGALFSVHHAPGQKQAQSRTCGEIREQYGLQRVEASFQTIDEINRNETLLPNVTLGIEIRDSCWYSPIALDQSIEFIRDAIKLNDDVIHDGNSSAPPAEISPECPIKPVKILKNLVGVVGPGSSTVTIQVQNLLQLFNIPQIGYSATSRDLSDKSFYKYFLRVVPSDFYQAQVMVDLVRTYNWTYVSTVHTDGNYGGSGMDAFVKQAHDAGICIAASDSVLSHAEDYMFDQVIRNLQKYPNARVVVCFCEGMTVRGLLKATRRLNATGEFLLIGSDGWSDRNDVTEEYEKEALGGISIRIHSTYDHSFDPYYFSLKPHNNSRNPWFREFWEYRFNCSLQNGSGKYNKTCSGNENLRERYKQDTKMSFVKKAIYTMAYGLHDMQKAKCNNSGLCAEMLPLNGSLFLQYLLNVSFVWENETVKFDENGDPPGRYDIMNFQFIPENNSYDYKHVGSWDSGKLDIFQSFRWNPKHATNGLPESVCSKPCERGKVKSIQSESVKCCWVCVACKENQFLEDEFTCKDCELGWWPNDNLTDCDRIPVDYIQWSDSTAIVSVTIAVLGMIATFFTMVVFILHNNTPVVKASTRELSYVILVGMYLCHSTTFPLLAKPTHTSCFLTRIMPGLSFAMMYASLVTKTNRIARILAGSKKKIITKKPRFMSGTAQVVITWLLISIESSIIGAMLVLEPADSMFSYPSLDKVDLICNTTPLGIIAPLGFDFFLIAMCTVYAVKTRNVPENFNEAKFIGFTMYTTLVIWVAFVPIYFGSNSKVITLCLCISFSAIVALVLLFFPKLYIILLRPEKNNRSAFTTTKDVRCHIGRGYPVSAATVSRNSSHSTSEFSLESPRNLSLDLVHKNQKSETSSRRPSMNLFVRLRISKQDKIAANVAQHIRAVRAAEALDRRTRLRRTDSFNFPGIPSTILPVQRSTSSAEDSPAGHDKKRLVGMIKQAYTEEVIEEIGSHSEDVACQTSYDLLEALLPSLRRRVMRSETSMTTDDEDIRHFGTPCKMGACYHKRPAYSDGGRHYSICDSAHGSMNVAYDTTSFTTKSSSRPRSRNRHRSDGREDRVEVEYKIPSDNDLVDYDMEEVISLKEMKRTKALQLLGKKGQYNKLQAMIGDGTSLCLPQEGASEASFSPTVSQDSLIDATSSIVEESASTGSDETSGSAVYKNIIINLGGNQDRSTRGLFSASQSSTTSAANLNLLPTITDSKISHSEESINEGGRRSSPDATKWSSPNGNPKGLAM